ncbi:MAG: hypothetical protein ABI478_00430 [Propionivibrio sp.]
MNATSRQLFRSARPLATASLLSLAALTAVSVLIAGCAAYPPSGESKLSAMPAPPSWPGVGEEVGIRVTGFHLSAHGSIIDLRYRVLDTDKAASLLDSKKRVYLIDDAHGGAKLGVPESPVIGAMRQTARNHVIYTDRDYFILFVNPGKAVRVGDTLKLAVGDQTIDNLTVR